MNTQKLHYFSGLFLSIFIGLHLFNHFWSIFGAAAHIDLMNTLRLFYRNVLIEPILVGSALVQVVSGLKLFVRNRKTAFGFFEKLHLGTGLYLAFFLLIHLSAVLVGRGVQNLDTNFYFGVAGLNTFPFLLFFIPYYGLSVFCFFGHIAAIHHKKMKNNILSFNPSQQAKIILFLGACITLLLFYGLTNQFQGVVLPNEYILK